MRAMLRALLLVTYGLLGLEAGAAPPAHLGSLSKTELQCAATLVRSVSRFAVVRSGCVRTCLKAARKTGGPYAHCMVPTAGEVGACIQDPVKGAQAKAEAAIQKKCGDHCPPCYQCSGGSEALDEVAATLDAYAREVYCVERYSATPTKTEAKCEDRVGDALVKLVARRARCFQACEARVSSGKLPPQACHRLAPWDARTIECLANADARAVRAIDRSCSAPGAAPACHGGATGTDWVARAAELLHEVGARRPDGTSCEDGKACTSGDFCYEGRCSGSDLCPGTACLSSWCDADTGTCLFEPFPCRVPPDPCYLETCRPQGCVAHCAQSECGTGPDGFGECREAYDCTVDADCEDDNPCTIDSCDLLSRICQHQVMSCNDGDPCTLDQCKPPLGCVFETLDLSTCDDGIACTEDTCERYVGCRSTPRDHRCEDGSPCTANVCDPGVFGGPTGCGVESFTCADGDPCTQDQCIAIPGEPLSCAFQPLCGP